MKTALEEGKIGCILPGMLECNRHKMTWTKKEETSFESYADQINYLFHDMCNNKGCL